MYPDYAGDIPYLTTNQMREVDRLMIEDYGIELIQMMENAGRSLAHLARTLFLGGDPIGKRVVVLAGTGGNGGGALVGARRLCGYGTQVQVFVTAQDERFAPISKHQLDILHRMGVPVEKALEGLEHRKPDLVIDGLIGYSLKDAPRGRAADFIRWANDSGAPILALDTPSGLDTSTGKAYVPAIRASATLTLALPKAGFRAPGSDEYVGDLYLADIGVPVGLYAKPSLQLVIGPIFAESDIIRLR